MAQQYRNPGKKKSQEPQLEAQVVSAIFKGIAALFRLIFGIKTPKKGFLTAKDSAELANHFHELQAMLTTSQLAKLAVGEADKILDRAMVLSGAQGMVFADRLRSLENVFGAPLYQEIWDAHKLRNRIAHEVGVEIAISEARDALSAFRSALRKLGVSL